MTDGKGKGAYADFAPLKTRRRAADIATDDAVLDRVEEPDDRGRDHGDGPDAPEEPDRRRLLIGLGAATVGLSGIATYAGTQFGKDAARTGQQRTAGFSPADAGGFSSREESYTAAESAGAASPQASTLYNTAGEAAANTPVTVPTILATGDPVIHLLRRTTFGPTPELVEEVHTKGIDAWLAEQMAPESIPDGTAEGVWGQFPRASMSPKEIRGTIERYKWDAMFEYGKATVGRQVWSNRQLYEVMVDFWANHLNVPMPSGPAWDVGVSYHNDVIRPHALGSFTDMLLAAMRHPGMLRYLDNTDSKKDSVNENLGRELLELHTVGIAGGYNEDDVRNSAYILTGRTEYRENDGPDREGTFRYDAGRHWVGPVAVLGFQHANSSAAGGLDMGEEYLRYLASHPSTARGISRKLAVRFVSDDPPESLVDRMTKQWQGSGGAVLPVLDVMFRSGEFWASVGQKTRRPLENLTAARRAVGVQPGDDTVKALDNWYWSLQRVGHAPLAWPSPNGYPDVRPAWRSASGLLNIWNSHTDVVQEWQKGLAYTPARELVGARPRGTVGEYVDSLCDRLCSQTFLPEHREALVAFVGSQAETPSGLAKMDDIVQHLAPVILHSPYFALR